MELATDIRAMQERTPQEWALAIRARWQDSVHSIIDVGRMLIEAKAALPHGDFGPMHDDLPWGDRTSRMLMETAQHPVISNRKYTSDLPAAWYTLYLLSRLPPNLLEKYIESHVIHPGLGQREAEEILKALDIMEVTIYSHKSTDYYTPPEYIEAAREVMGAIDLDPATCEFAQRYIKAERFYTEKENGLAHTWHGRVWLNPPYSKTGARSNQEIWAEKLTDEYATGNVTEAILLVKAAVGYAWFENLWDRWSVCFARERLSFVKADGNDDGQSKQGSAFFYLGSNRERFQLVFQQFGRIIMPEN